MTETRGLYPTLFANCIVNAFLSYTATVLNIYYNNTSAQKNVVTGKAFKNTAP